MESEIIVSRGRIFTLLPRTYWHLAHPTAGFLLNNVAANEGICWSISEIRKTPGLEKAASPYSSKFFMGDKKEIVWGQVRINVNPRLPSRNGAIFLFEDEEMALTIMAKWFPTELRHLLEVRVVRDSSILRCDSKWLDCNEDQWKKNAFHYWSGNMTSDPIPEILIEGAVYFPGWQRKPFGIGEGMPTSSS